MLLPPKQHPTPTTSPPIPPPQPHLQHPLPDPIRPRPTDQNPAHDIHQLDDQAQKARPLLRHHQQDRLDIVLEENARDDILADIAALAGRRVLVREDAAAVGLLSASDQFRGRVHVHDFAVLADVGGEVERRGGGDGGGVERALAVEDAGGAGVDGGDDGEVVLEFVEVRGGGGEGVDGVVKGVEEGGIVWTKGKFGDGVGEIEGWSNCQNTFPTNRSDRVGLCS